VTSYADDTYVCVSDNDLFQVKTKLEATMTLHNRFLTEIGMVTNVSKTELIYFSRRPTDAPSLLVENQTVVPTQHIKVLGVQFSNDLSWDHHITNTINKARPTILKLKYLTKYLNTDALKKVATSHFYGLFYYGSTVWLNEQTTAQQWQKLNSIHYRVQRVCIRDFRNKKSRLEVNAITQRATPLQWMKYSNCKQAVGLFLQKEKSTRLGIKLQTQSYINDRCPGKATMIDHSKLKIGRQCFPNRLRSMKDINFDWVNGISDDMLRIKLKRTFFNT